MSNSSSAWVAPCMTGQSESDPMTTPTTASVDSAIDLSGQIGSRMVGALAEVGQIGSGDGDVADLPSRAYLLAVHVNPQLRIASLAMDVSRVRIDRPTPLVKATEHVHQHGVRRPRGRRSQWQVEHRTQMLLELTGDGSIDGPVAGVVRPHGQLVHEEAVRGVEHLDRE